MVDTSDKLLEEQEGALMRLWPMVLGRADHLRLDGRRDAAHDVMDGRHHWDRLFVGIDAGKNACCLDDAGQALIEQIRRQLLEMQVDMVLFRADTAPLADFDWSFPVPCRSTKGR
jgi:hypothetical protein